MSATRSAASRPVPSIRSRLANALAVWSVLWGLAVGGAVWLAASQEVEELLDDALMSSVELLAALIGQTHALPADVADAAASSAAASGSHNGVTRTPRSSNGEPAERFAWQVVAADGRLQMRSSRAPDQPWRMTPSAGFGEAAGWRLYGMALGSDGGMLYAAQSREERQEARAEVALSAMLAALAVGLLGHVWLRSRVRAELQPLQALSDRLEAWDVDAAMERGGPSLGAAERRELQPVTRALEALTARLAERIANEQAFSAHAAHALRTPLAAIDAQLAVALRDCPPGLAERLQRVRGAAGRLQGVVAALLGLFRTGAEAQRAEVDLGLLMSRLPTPALAVQVSQTEPVRGDADLLAAALVNLLDNAQRHGAAHAWLETPAPDCLRLRDDGPGVGEARRAALQAALDQQAYDGVTGLGLLLADRVARTHGGRLRLPAVGSGFAVEIDLRAPASPAGPAGNGRG